MSAPAAFAEREFSVIKVAREIDENATYWTTGGGAPLYAILLARMLGYAPNAVYVTEDGVIAPEPVLPFPPMGAMTSSQSGYRAAYWGTMNTAGEHASLGFMDYGTLGARQIDQGGTINSTLPGGS